jgi:hypothetical protein
MPPALFLGRAFSQGTKDPLASEVAEITDMHHTWPYTRSSRRKKKDKTYFLVPSFQRICLKGLCIINMNNKQETGLLDRTQYNI